jgi:acyl-CoA thioester hydrolase
MLTTTTQVRVRYADTDQMGIVYNGVYFVYFEIGRTELLRECGLPYAEIERQGLMLPVLESHAVYKNPAMYDDLLDIHTTFENVLKPTIRLDYKVFKNDIFIAEGYTVHSFLKADTRRPVRPPRSFHEKIASYIEAHKGAK